MPSTRRTVLRRIGSLAVAFSIAGCSESRSDDTRESSPRTNAEARTSHTPLSTGTSTETPAETRTETPTETATPRASGCDPGPRPDAAWPLAQRGYTHANYISNGSPFDGSPSEAWSVAATVPPDIDGYDAAFGQPVIADDLIYAVDRVLFGPNVEDPGGHILQARDRMGELAWSYRLPKRPPSPAVWNDLVVVPSGDTVYALDRHDGFERWTRSLNASGRVVPADDRLYVWGEKLFALAPDGQTIWERSVGDGIAEAPAVGFDSVYAGLYGGDIAALDPETGETRWTADTPRGTDESGALSPTIYSILTTECAVFVVTDGDIDAFDTSGEFRWHVEGYYFNLATDGTTLYGRDRTGDPLRTVLRARHAATGELRWERRGEVVSAAHGVLTDEALYVPMYDELVAIASEDGRERWRTTPAIETIAFAEGTLYGTLDDGSLIALRW